MKQYRARKSNRLKEYDYSLVGYYYVTICTYNRQEIFGVAGRDKMEINPYGKIVKDVWLEISKHFENVELDEFIVMPNHIHGIIEIANVPCDNTSDICRANINVEKNRAKDFSPLRLIFPFLIIICVIVAVVRAVIIVIAVRITSATG